MPPPAAPAPPKVFAECVQIDGAIDVVKDLVEDDLAADIFWRTTALQEAVELVREQAAQDDQIQQAPIGIFQVVVPYRP